MLTKAQIKSLDKGFHSNIELMQKFPDSKHFSKKIHLFKLKNHTK